MRRLAKTVRTAARLEGIWIKRARRGPMDPVERATLVEGEGILGNADVGGRRQVTVIDDAAWKRATADLGREIDPSERRANLLVRGIDLRETRGRALEIGPCRIRIGGETRPCNLMDEASPGLQDALDPEWRGGVYGVVEVGGEIAVGDRVELRPEA